MKNSKKRGYSTEYISVNQEADTEIPDQERKKSDGPDHRRENVSEQGRKANVPDQRRETNVSDQRRESVPDQGRETNVPDQGRETNVPDQRRENVPDQERETNVPAQRRENIPDQGRENIPDQGRETNVPNQRRETNVPDQGRENVPDQGKEKSSETRINNRHIHLVPPDGGWGWMIVFGGFITIVLGSFPLFSFSILFSPLLMASDVSSTKTAWIFNIHGFVWSVYTVFLGPLCEEYGWRKISILGGIANFLSIFLSVFAFKADLLFVTFSVLGGIGGSTGFTVCFLAVSRYFVKHRGFAIAITTLGSTISSFLSPLLANYLLENFGFMGASLIYSAIILNQCVGGALFQPVEWHMIPSEEDPDSQGPAEELLRDSQMSANGNDKLTLEKLNDKSNKFDDSVPSINFVRNSARDLSSPHNKLSVNNVKDRNMCNQFKKIMKLTLENLKTLTFARVKLIAVAYGCLLLGYVNFQMWIPFIVTNAGYTLEIAAWCVSIGSITNGVGKIGMSLVSDRNWFNVKYGFMFGVLVIGLSIIAFSFVQRVETFFTISSCWGFGVGIALSLHTMAMIDIMGVELLPALLGVSSLFKGIINLLFGPLVGFARDTFSSYIYAMCLLGGVDLLGFCLWLFMPLAAKYDQKMAKKHAPV